MLSIIGSLLQDLGSLGQEASQEEINNQAEDSSLVAEVEVRRLSKVEVEPLEVAVEHQEDVQVEGAS